MQTQSDHRMLAADDLARLLEGVADAIESCGGSITVPYTTEPTLARKA